MTTSPQKPPEPWNYRPLVYLITILFSVLCLLIGYWFHTLAEPTHPAQNHQDAAASDTPAKTHYGWELASHVANEVGVAGLIAMVLVFTIDRLTRKESTELAEHHQQKMKEIADENEKAIRNNVFQYVFGHAFPEAVVAEIKAQLLHPCFLRHGQKVRHDLSPSPGRPEYLTLVTTMEFEVENISHKNQTYPLTWYIEEDPEPGLPEGCAFLYLDVKAPDGKPVLQCDEATLIRQTNRQVVPNHLCFKGQIPLPAKSRIKVVRRMRTTKRMAYDNDIFNTIDATTGLTVEVQLHNGLSRELEVQAYTFHPEEFKEGNGHVPAQGVYCWHVANPLLPFQGAFVAWKKRRAPLGLSTAPGNAVVSEVPEAVGESPPAPNS